MSGLTPFATAGKDFAVRDYVRRYAGTAGFANEVSARLDTIASAVPKLVEVIDEQMANHANGMTLRQTNFLATLRAEALQIGSELCLMGSRTENVFLP